MGTEEDGDEAIPVGEITMTNMEHYINFVNVFNMFVKDEKMPMRRSFPKGSGDWTTEQFEEFASSMRTRISMDIQRCQPYEIDDRTKRAMLMTNIPNKKEILQSLRLPYPAIFLDIELTNDDEDLGYGTAVKGILISEQYITQDDVFFMVHFTLQQEEGISIEHFKISWTDIKDKINHAKITNNIRDILQRLIVNSILFIEDPEIEECERVRTNKNAMRRIQDGKMPLPSSKVLKLTGSIKKYFDDFGADYDGGREYSHMFDVRGTWRHFKAERFVRLNKMSQVELQANGYRMRNGFVARWVPPFKKGKGIYIKKTYRLAQPKGDDSLEFEDIKPLDRPLSEMKR